MNRQHRHPLDTDLLAFTTGEADPAGAAAITEHLAGCLICRVHLNRLRRAGVTSTTATTPTGRVPTVSPAVIAALAAATHPAIANGQLWLAGESQHTLVWIEDADTETGFAIVNAATFDTAGADDSAVIVTLPEYDLEVAVLGSVSGAIPLSALRVFVANLDIAKDLRRTRGAAFDGTAGDGIVSGAPMRGVTDERREFRQLLADDLAALDPIDDEAWELDEAVNSLLKVELAGRRGDRCKVEPFWHVPVLAPDFRLVAHVHELDCRIVVAFGSWVQRPQPEWDSISQFVLDVGGTTLAMTGTPEPFETALFELRHLHPAFELPDASTVRPPRPFFAPRPLLKALDHYLDIAVFHDSASNEQVHPSSQPPAVEPFLPVFAAQAISNRRSMRAQLGKNRALKGLNDSDASHIAEALAELAPDEVASRLREIADR